MSWCPSWSNSLWQGWSRGLVLCPGGNATDPIWRVLASSDGISSWTPLKPQHRNTNPNPLANQLWCIGFLTPPTPIIIPHRLRAFLESLMPLKNWYSIHARCSKSSLKHSMRFCGIFFQVFQNRISMYIVPLKCPHVQIAFLKFTSCDISSRVYSNPCCIYSFEPEIIKIGLSSYKMYSNNIFSVLREAVCSLQANNKSPS